MFNRKSVAVLCHLSLQARPTKVLQNIAKRYELDLYSCLSDMADNCVYYLSFQGNRLSITPLNTNRGGALYVDFDSPQANFRRQTSGIKQEIAKAVGCKSDYRPGILDVTAGLGGDAFVLAALGCKMSLIEKNPIVYELLLDGLFRGGGEESNAHDIIRQNMTLLPCQDALEYLRSNSGCFEVVYLDPMFPQRVKAAKVKKAMQYFHDIVGLEAEQESALFIASMQVAKKRVVIKRPKQAPLLAGAKPSHQIKSKTIRYDVYVK